MDSHVVVKQDHGVALERAEVVRVLTQHPGQARASNGLQLC